MERIGIYEAKSRLSELVEQAQAGKEVTITRHGKAVAKLVPVRAGREVDRKGIMDEIRAFSRTVKLKRKLTMRELREAIEWGRR
ncbi:MAG: type II toxin-antitoxin system prevent-host-death family antitoxin [Betaproteobacteria bacterium]|nr:type II toxin-antitoxin system prevent-host-death family antitoxin [Betaproteobacteria bacterium]